jgi:hypothetical protein
MFLKHTPTGDLIEVIDLPDVIDPFSATVRGRQQAGEDTMDIDEFEKTDLVFPSGEPLPLCWRDSHYRKKEASTLLYGCRRRN